MSGDAAERARRRHRRVREATPLARLHRLFEGRCAYCDRDVALDDATRDHVHPRSAGGRGDGNLVLACAPCNRTKGAAREGERYRLTPRARRILASLT